MALVVVLEFLWEKFRNKTCQVLATTNRGALLELKVDKEGLWDLNFLIRLSKSKDYLCQALELMIAA